MNCYNHPETTASAFCRSCGRPLCALCQRNAEGVIFCPEHAPVVAGVGAAAGGAAAGTPAGGWSAQSAPPPPSASNPAGGDPANPYVAPPPPPPGSSSVPPPGAGMPPPPPGFAAPPSSFAAPPFPGGRPDAGSPILAFVFGLIPGVGAIYNGQYVKGLVHAAIFGMLVTIASHGGGNIPIIGMSVAAFYAYMPFEAFHTARKRQMGIPVEEWSSLMTQRPSSFPVPIGPIILILLGVVFLLNSLNLLDMEAVVRFWPILLIIGGIAMLMGRLRGSRAMREAQTRFHAAAASETFRER